jgi:hypothetical protein
VLMSGRRVSEVGLFRRVVERETDGGWVRRKGFYASRCDEPPLGSYGGMKYRNREVDVDIRSPGFGPEAPLSVTYVLVT